MQLGKGKGADSSGSGSRVERPTREGRISSYVRVLEGHKLLNYQQRNTV